MELSLSGSSNLECKPIELLDFLPIHAKLDLYVQLFVQNRKIIIEKLDLKSSASRVWRSWIIDVSNEITVGRTSREKIIGIFLNIKYTDER